MRLYFRERERTKTRKKEKRRKLQVDSIALVGSFPAFLYFSSLSLLSLLSFSFLFSRNK
jgi:hypothetical protein